MECLNKIVLETDFNIILRPGPFEDYRTFLFLEKKSNYRIKVDYKSSLPEFVLDTDVLLTC